MKIWNSRISYELSAHENSNTTKSKEFVQVAKSIRASPEPLQTSNRYQVVTMPLREPFTSKRSSSAPPQGIISLESLNAGSPIQNKQGIDLECSSWQDQNIDNDL